MKQTQQQQTEKTPNVSQCCRPYIFDGDQCLWAVAWKAARHLIFAKISHSQAPRTCKLPSSARNLTPPSVKYVIKRRNKKKQHEALEKQEG